MSYHIEHPEITHCMRTGYPSYNQPEECYCSECGKNITEDEKFQRVCYEYLCVDCLLDIYRVE